jgi:dTDP-4-amino-4,6-dideoxygalactose transaminase
MNEIRRTAERTLAAASGRAHAVLTGNGTTALWAALAALDLPDGAAVVYPTITCETAVNAAVFAGLRPVFADVDPATAAASIARLTDAARRHDAGVIVPTHIFGRVDSTAGTDAGPPDLPRIVDAAQSAGTAACVGDGRAAVLSFGPGKQLDLGGGGALLTDDPVFASNVRDLLSTLPGDAGEAERLRGAYMLDLVRIGREHPEGTRAHADQRIASLREHRHGYLRPVPAELPARLTAALPARARDLDRRRAVAWLLRDRLSGLPGLQPLDLGPRQTPWRLTLQVATGRDDAAAALTRAGLRTSRLFSPVHRLFGEPDADFPDACAVADRLLNLDLAHLGAPPAEAADRAVEALTAITTRELDHVAS